MIVGGLQLPFYCVLTFDCEGCYIWRGTISLSVASKFQNSHFLQFYLTNSIRYNTFVIFLYQTNVIIL